MFLNRELFIITVRYRLNVVVKLPFKDTCRHCPSTKLKSGYYVIVNKIKLGIYSMIILSLYKKYKK